MSERALSDLRSRILRRFEASQPQHELADWRAARRRCGAQPPPAAALSRRIRWPPRFSVPLVDRPEGLTVLLTQRASQLAKHAAQISFPGGRLERHPMPDVASAALREAQEEIGLDPARVRVVRLSTRSPGHQRLSRDAGPVAGDAAVFARRSIPTKSPRCSKCRVSSRFRPRNHKARTAARRRRGSCCCMTFRGRSTASGVRLPGCC